MAATGDGVPMEQRVTCPAEGSLVPGERVSTGLEPSLSPSELALRANLLLTRTLLSRATQVTLEVEGDARVLVRYAKLRGLMQHSAET